MVLKSNYSNLKSYSISRFYEKYIFSRERLTRLRGELSGLRSNIKFLLYFTLDKNPNLVIFLIFLHNCIEALWLVSFYWIFGYPLLLLIYISSFLIYYDLDLICSLLWLICGNIFTLSFTLFILWLDGSRWLNRNYKNRLIFFLLYTFLYFYTFIIVSNLDYLLFRMGFL